MDKITLEDNSHKVVIEHEGLDTIQEVFDVFIVPGLLGMTFDKDTILKAMLEYVEAEDYE